MGLNMNDDFIQQLQSFINQKELTSFSMLRLIEMMRIPNDKKSVKKYLKNKFLDSKSCKMIEKSIHKKKIQLNDILIKVFSTFFYDQQYTLDRLYADWNSSKQNPGPFRTIVDLVQRITLFYLENWSDKTEDKNTDSSNMEIPEEVLEQILAALESMHNEIKIWFECHLTQEIFAESVLRSVSRTRLISKSEHMACIIRKQLIELKVDNLISNPSSFQAELFKAVREADRHDFPSLQNIEAENIVPFFERDIIRWIKTNAVKTFQLSISEELASSEVFLKFFDAVNQFQKKWSFPNETCIKLVKDAFQNKVIVQCTVEYFGEILERHIYENNIPRQEVRSDLLNQKSLRRLDHIAWLLQPSNYSKCVAVAIHADTKQLVIASNSNEKVLNEELITNPMKIRLAEIRKWTLELRNNFAHENHDTREERRLTIRKYLERQNFQQFFQGGISDDVKVDQLNVKESIKRNVLDRLVKIIDTILFESSILGLESYQSGLFLVLTPIFIIANKKQVDDIQANSPIKELKINGLHAEQLLVDYATRNNIRLFENKIGIGKLCCWECYNEIKNDYTVSGTHGSIFKGTYNVRAKTITQNSAQLRHALEREKSPELTPEVMPISPTQQGLFARCEHDLGTGSMVVFNL